MKSLRIGTLAGIGIYVHWTFYLLIGWLLLSGWMRGEGLLAVLGGVGLVLTLFGCVVLHELGHALAARRFGIPTRDITLLPIGGVARLERMPDQPWQELVVALAGPAVNVVIAAALGTLLGLTVGPQAIAPQTGFLQDVMWVNVGLVVFNLLPAFPMDGGRVLRALLAMVLDYTTATRYAARVGQVLAVGLAVLGIFVLQNPFLPFLAAFVFLGAMAETRQVERRAQSQLRRVRDAMLTRFQAVPNYLQLEPIAGQLMSGDQRDFPVLRQGELCGMLRREDILEALAAGRGSARLGDLARTDFPVLFADEPLVGALERTHGSAHVTLPVFSAQGFEGLLDVPRVIRQLAAQPSVPGPALATPAPQARS